MKDYTIADFLKENAGKDNVSFHMPGHKGRSALYEEAGYAELLRNAAAWDITEIPGADSLFSPRGALRNVMDNYAELYGARHTELLVNGSSAGIIAAIISSVPVGGKLILGRNSHHAAFSALRLGGINPVYLRPETDPDFNIAAEISPYELEEACEQNPDASAVLITSPNYCGMLSDIDVLADIAHDHGMLLIVDQAHGAHLRFFDYDAERCREDGGYIPHPKHAAESLGADIVINSTHKTLLSFTGSGILNICGDSVDINAVSETLRMVQTTSPSYLLMASLDINEKIMRNNWRRIITSWKEDLTGFYKGASRIKGLTVVTGSGARGSGSQDEDVFALYRYREGPDPTKINLSMSELGLSGERLEKELRYRGIITEMTHGEYVLLMTGAGNTRSDYEKLLDALEDIASGYGIGTHIDRTPRSFDDIRLDYADVPVDGEYVPLYEAVGRVLYDPIVTYPPGTPIACPGEVLSMEVISHISDILEDGEYITGVDDEGMIKVGTGY
ncbi:MAG: aminotransferase class V-fold PLP-dependent enzyme [Mogibacterium sp.]|nr:aminotransferase class V-fold PLP-dependent enzyme [Mogibacterium sp.]